MNEARFGRCDLVLLEDEVYDYILGLNRLGCHGVGILFDALGQGNQSVCTQRIDCRFNSLRRAELNLMVEHVALIRDNWTPQIGTLKTNITIRDTYNEEEHL